MKYYSRSLLKRQVNQFGELVYKPYIEYFKTERESFVKEVNKYKHYKFTETSNPKLIEALDKWGEVDHVYSEERDKCTFI